MRGGFDLENTGKEKKLSRAMPKCVKKYEKIVAGEQLSGEISMKISLGYFL